LRAEAYRAARRYSDKQLLPYGERVKHVAQSYLKTLLVFIAFALLPAALVPASDRDDEASQAPGAAAYLTALRAGRVEQLDRPEIAIGYQLAPDSPPPVGADLYVSTDEGASWTKAPIADPLANPLPFTANTDGLYGFYIVLHGETGCTPDPLPGTVPQRWVMVDRETPMIRLRRMEIETTSTGGNILHLEWLATDATNNLPVGPVTLSYQTDNFGAFVAIARNLDARGSFDWHMPMNVTGELRIQLTATDRAGNRDTFTSHPKIIGTQKATGRVRTNKSVSINDTNNDSQDDSQANHSSSVKLVSANKKSQDGTPLSPFAERRDGSVDADEIVDAATTDAETSAEKRYDLARWHRARGEYRLALRYFREALDADANLYKAQNDLATTHLLLGELDAAEAAYRTVIESEPMFAPALEGLSVVQIKQRRYRSAQATLNKLVQLRPNDADVLIQFGDACLFVGDRRAARSAWQKAAAQKDVTPELKEKANRRLSIYQHDRLSALRDPLE